MKLRNLLLLLSLTIGLGSCVSKKKFSSLEESFNTTKDQLAKSDAQLSDYMKRYNDCEEERKKLKSQDNTIRQNLTIREEQIADLKMQVDDLRTQRDRQLDRFEDLTVLSKSASENIKATLDQLATKDKYIRLLQAAKSKSDSLNLALAVNLKGVLAESLNDQDVEISVDKTVVMINLSDKMLFRSGKATLSSKANEVLGKISKILASRPDFDVMVEGYTDNVPISKDCIQDNWDLSVKRSTAVVRLLSGKFGIDPNRLIAAGRGEYNALTSNDTAEGRATNRRTRIIIMPKLDQFYDLLDPSKAAQKVE